MTTKRHILYFNSFWAYAQKLLIFSGILCLTNSLLAQPDLQSAIRKGNLLIHLPPIAKDSACPLLICFAGSMWATPEFLWSETPEAYFEKAILVYSPCFVRGGKGLKQTEATVLDFLAKKGISIREKSVCGFSSGGPDAMIVESPAAYRAIGLIDCTPRANGKVHYASNMIFSFRRNNWIYSDYYGEKVGFRPFEQLLSNLDKAGGFCEETQILHKNYFHYFLQKFEAALIGSDS